MMPTRSSKIVLSISIRESCEPRLEEGEALEKREKVGLHVARKKQKKLPSSSSSRVARKPKWGGVGIEGGMVGRKRGWWRCFGPSGAKWERAKGGSGVGAGGFDSSKNCTFFSPIEWPGRHLNTLCVFHPWG